MKRVLFEFIGLQTPRARLGIFVGLSIVIFIVPYSWLEHLSLWQSLNIPSPSIGLTRAYHLLLHGDVAGAWERNRLIFVVLGVGLPLLLRDLYAYCKKQPR